MFSVIPRKLLRNYKLSLSIALFVSLLAAVQWMKPGFAFLPNGAYRPFGVGYKHKTVIPMWVVSIILATFSYTFLLFCLQNY